MQKGGASQSCVVTALVNGGLGLLLCSVYMSIYPWWSEGEGEGERERERESERANQRIFTLVKPKTTLIFFTARPICQVSTRHSCFSYTDKDTSKQTMWMKHGAVWHCSAPSQTSKWPPCLPLHNPDTTCKAQGQHCCVVLVSLCVIL